MKNLILYFYAILLLFSCNEKKIDKTTLNCSNKCDNFIPYTIWPEEKLDTIFNNSIKFDTVSSNKDIIPNEKMAVLIGYLYLSNVYGEKIIKSEFPLMVSSKNNMWLVSGTLPEGYYGGVAVIYLNKSNGKVEKYIHYK